MTDRSSLADLGVQGLLIVCTDLMTKKEAVSDLPTLLEALRLSEFPDPAEAVVWALENHEYLFTRGNNMAASWMVEWRN